MIHHQLDNFRGSVPAGPNIKWGTNISQGKSWHPGAWASINRSYLGTRNLIYLYTPNGLFDATTNDVWPCSRIAGYNTDKWPWLQNAFSSGFNKYNSKADRLPFTLMGRLRAPAISTDWGAFFDYGYYASDTDNSQRGFGHSGSTANMTRYVRRNSASGFLNGDALTYPWDGSYMVSIYGSTTVWNWIEMWKEGTVQVNGFSPGGIFSTDTRCRLGIGTGANKSLYWFALYAGACDSSNITSGHYAWAIDKIWTHPWDLLLIEPRRSYFFPTGAIAISRQQQVWISI